MPEEQFLIHELAARAGTSVRTIRYYTVEGILPQPLIQGKYAYYTEAHLKRLELIRRMKDTYLPLREIREIMNSLTDAEVDRRLSQPSTASQGVSEPPGQFQAESGPDALQYISRLLQEQAGHRSEGTVNTPPSYSARKEKPLPAALRPAAQPSPAAAPETEKWQRICLTPGIELHVREQNDPETTRRIQELLDYVNKLFNLQNSQEEK